MSGFTIYLDEMEERDRKQRRRAKFLGAIAIVATFVAMRAPKEPPPTVVTKTIFRSVPMEIECSVMQPAEKEKRVIVAAPEKPPIPLLPMRGRQIELIAATPTRHLCVTPKHLLPFADNASDHFTVSNIGETPIRITQIETVPERSPFFVNASDCGHRTLQAGDRCTIAITLLEAHGEKMDLRIASDSGEDETIRVTAAASPATPAPGK